MKRRWHRLRAALGGYFWRPCSVCGAMFGGHERGGGTTLESPGRGKMTCPGCPGEWARGADGNFYRLQVLMTPNHRVRCVVMLRGNQ